MGLDKASTIELLDTKIMPAFWAERTRLDRIDNWYRWNHQDPTLPRKSTREYQELSSRSQTPWLGLVVTAVAQSLYVDGYRSAADPGNANAWQYWQANGLDNRQIAINRAALAYGQSYTVVLPGEDELTGASMPVIRGVSPRRMIAFWADPAWDDYPKMALEANPAIIDGKTGWDLRLYDDEYIWYCHVGGTGEHVEYVTFDEHNLGVCPVVRFANQLDLEGRADGEVDPFIPVAARVDQTVFDRLVVQRFSAWVVRYVAGMAKPDDADEAEAEKLRLAVEDILVAEDPDTKFGTLAATPLDGFISARDADIRDLAAVTQTPPHHLLGQMANLSAEALAAAEASLSRKVEERKHTLGESYEQTLRLAAHVAGDEAGAADVAAQVRWRDMESRSLAQAADALGKMATMLGVPVEVLWEKIPGWTQQDVERAKEAAKSGDTFAQLESFLSKSSIPPAA